MPGQSSFVRIFVDRGIYPSYDAKTENWFWDHDNLGLLAASDEDSVNILVQYNPSEDPEYGT